MKIHQKITYFAFLVLAPLIFINCGGGGNNDVSSTTTTTTTAVVVTGVGVIPAGAKVFTTFKDDTIHKRFVAMKNEREEYFYTTYGSSKSVAANEDEYIFGFIHITFSASSSYTPFTDSDYFTIEATKSDAAAIEAKRLQLNAIFVNAAYWQTLRVNNNLTRAIAIISNTGVRHIIDLNFPILANPVVGYSSYSNYYIQNGHNYAVGYDTYIINESQFIKL